MQKVRFKDLYRRACAEKTAAQKLLSEAAELTDRAEVTVKKWALGEVTPDRNVINILAKRFDADPDYLFEPRKPRKK